MRLPNPLRMSSTMGLRHLPLYSTTSRREDLLLSFRNFLLIQSVMQVSLRVSFPHDSRLPILGLAVHTIDDGYRLNVRPRGPPPQRFLLERGERFPLSIHPGTPRLSTVNETRGLAMFTHLVIQDTQEPEAAGSIRPKGAGSKSEEHEGKSFEMGQVYSASS